MREEILKKFYVDRIHATKNVAIHYIEEAFNDFFITYPFNEKKIVEYKDKDMLNHIIFDLLRMLGDPAYRTYELLIDYVYDIYNRTELEHSARINFENIKFKDVN
ncbi:MAG: hypothetical protein HDQ88_04805 [Clostridia bacterium]|nr:hypothetical protein [Clostridia bacterium]